MSASQRKFYEIQTSINVKIILPESNVKVNFDSIESISLYNNQNLNKQFKSYLLKNNIKLGKEYYFYLQKGEDIIRILPKNKKVKDLKLQPNDLIVVSYEKKQIKSQSVFSVTSLNTLEENINNNINSELKQNPIIYPKEKSIEINDYQKDMEKKKKIIKILIIALSLVVLAGLVFLVIYLKKNKKIGAIAPTPPIFIKDKLVIEKKYPINMILEYSNKKETEIKLEGEKKEKKIYYRFLFVQK